MKEKDILVGHIEDLAARAAITGCSASRFLTPAEAQQTAGYFSRRRDVQLVLDGGYEAAERVRAVFLNPEWGEYSRDGIFVALKVSYRQQDTLGHRDILGALMALGIERNTIGDIIVEGSASTIICLPEIGGYILDNLTKAGRVGVRISQIALDDLSVKTQELRIKTDTVASLRLDAVICAAFGLSRGRAVDMIAAGLVSLDHKPCFQSAKEVTEDSVLSVRGLGRARLTKVAGVSRKGRIFIELGLY